MENQIRILNERDRQTLLWLRTHVGEARLKAAVGVLARAKRKPYVSAVCRYLGVYPPVTSAPQAPSSDHTVGDHYLARMHAQLARLASSRAR